MYRDEDVGVISVCNADTFVKAHCHIFCPCVDDLHVGVCFLDDVAGFHCDSEGDVLFLAFLPHRAGVFPAMSSVNNNSPDFVRLRQERRRQDKKPE